MTGTALKTLILCGGRGTRAYPHTLEVPKPLLEVAGKPILGQVLEIYAAQGFTDFVLAAGYRGDLIVEFACQLDSSWTVEVIETGEDTNTGGRIWACRDEVGDTFFANYADGVGNVDLASLQAFHASHLGSATLTTVPLPSQYGTIETRGDGRVEGFREKPLLPDHRINAGFFVFDRRVFDQWGGEDLERDVLPALAAAGELYAYPHHGFWKSMDTYKDAVELTAMCEAGDAPWFGSSGANV